MSRWVLDQLDSSVAEHVRAMARRAWAALAGYLRAITLQALAGATMKTIGLLILGVPLVAPLALLTFFGGYLPLVGAVTASVVAAAVAPRHRGTRHCRPLSSASGCSSRTSPARSWTRSSWPGQSGCTRSS